MKPCTVKTSKGVCWKVVLLYKDGKQTKRGLLKLIRDTFASSHINEGLIKSHLAFIEGCDGYLMDREGNVFKAQTNEKVKIQYYSSGHPFIQLKVNNKRICRKLEPLRQDILQKDLRVRIVEFPEYKLDQKGNIYNRFGKKLKIKTEEKDGCALVQFNILTNGIRERKTRSVGKLIAEHLIPNPFGYSHFHYKDSNPFNIALDNIEWIGDEDHGIKHSNRLKKAFARTRDYAIKHCKCPILKKYYETGDREILNALFAQIDTEMKTKINYWDTAKGAVFDLIMDRIERFGILGYPLKYVALISKHYKNGIKFRQKDKTVEFNLNRRKIRKKRITVDDLEFTAQTTP